MRLERRTRWGETIFFLSPDVKEKKTLKGVASVAEDGIHCKKMIITVLGAEPNVSHSSV